MLISNYMNIAVIGVGYVGLITGLSFAKLGNNVNFLDIDKTKIDNLKNNIPTFVEPQLIDYLNNDLIIQNTNYFHSYEAVNWSEIEVVFICVQTPMDEKGNLDSTYLLDVFKNLNNRFNSILCIKSTIHPGAIESIFEETKTNLDDVVFNPEFLREGSAFEDFFNTDRVVIGSNNINNAKKVGKLYDDFDTEIIYTDPISSQLIKYLANAYLPLRISFANEAARLADKLGGNQKDILNGIGLDHRIGNQYFRPSPGWGGSCFPKDVAELQSISNLNDFKLPIIDSIITSNENHIDWFVEKLLELKLSHNLNEIILIGAAFKENTDDLRDSPTLKIYKKLINKNIQVSIYDKFIKLDNNFKIAEQFDESTLFVEMYPLNDDYQEQISSIQELKNFYYFKFWDQ